MAAGKTSPKRKPRAKTRIPIVQALPDGILILDARDRITDLNPAAAAMTGVEEKAALGKAAQKVFAAWPEGDTAIRTAKESIRLPSPVHPDRTLEISRYRIPSGRRKTTGHLILIRDISDRIRMEQDHKRSMELLLEQNTEMQTLRVALRDQSIRDPLTNLYNLSYMIETLDRELAQAARRGTPISILRIRLDRFEDADALYGEKAGVEIVKIIGSLLIRHIRKGDLACRSGTDEFVVILAGASSAVAAPRAEQLRQAFHDSILNFLGAHIECTFSCGVSSYPNQGVTTKALLEAAEQALQTSITSGGNRVTVCE
jgi:diguanylate cyclase (GGDEF)-like protein/PAS domain S-box-containing protein